MGGNGGPPFSDPRTLEQVVPQLRNTPAGAILAIPDSFFMVTAPAHHTIATVHQDRVMNLIGQIQAIDPHYHYESLGAVQTPQGRINEINKLRSDRAMALYRIRGDAGALQVEVLRFAQSRVDIAYEEAVKLYEARELPRGLSRNNAIGNYIDLKVRRDMQMFFNSYGIDHTTGTVRVIGRQYDTSGMEPTYVVPDARVEFGDYDWTMEAKTPGKRQVRGFFNSDLRPAWTIIIRPSQLGPNHTYIITSPRR
jgi:hypothetical protein